MNFFQKRKTLGRVYASILPNGLTVPWKPLSIGDYIKYTQDTHRGIYPLPLIENEICDKCVLDESFKRQSDYLNAGIFSTIANNIWEHSGPTGIDAFNNDLENTRAEMFGADYSVINEMVQLITIAFPYTPEDIYEMSYETFLQRTVQAERKLLFLGIIQEPIIISSPESSEKEPEKPKPKIDAKKLYEQQQKIVENQKLLKGYKPDLAVSALPKKKWWKTSPILEAPSPQTINFKLESAEIAAFGQTGWEKQDAELSRVKMIKDAQVIYKDVLKELAERKKGA